jgi:hypothetical protein
LGLGTPSYTQAPNLIFFRNKTSTHLVVVGGRGNMKYLWLVDSIKTSVFYLYINIEVSESTDYHLAFNMQRLFERMP